MTTPQPMQPMQRPAAALDLFDSYKGGYLRNWQSMKVRPERLAEANQYAEVALKYQTKYMTCQRIMGIPWWFFPLVHSRENAADYLSGHFGCYLGNGQPLTRRTTLVPAGRGPFSDPGAFEKGALDAMQLQGFIEATDWSIERCSFRWEGYNGFGYHSRGVPSPYLYGGSTVYGPPDGKFVADRVYNARVRDTQLGVLTIFKQLTELDPAIVVLPDSNTPQPDDYLFEGVLWCQQTLNRINPRTGTKLLEDGLLGARTMTALMEFQTSHQLTSTGLPDQPTVNALQAAASALARPSAAQHPSLAPAIIALMQSCYGGTQ